MMEKTMELKALRKLADDDAVTLSLDDQSGIVSVLFTVNGISFEAQYSDTNDGIYAFSLVNEEQAGELFELLALTHEAAA